MFAIAYRSADLLDNQRRNAWEKQGREHLRSLYGSTVGIVGLGYIGQALATRCKAMGMRVLGYRRKDEPIDGVDKIYTSVEAGGLEKLLEQSDYVVLALPLTNESYHLMTERTLAYMKPSAHLINIARGDVVDETALISALETNMIAGAGLDVFSQEPLPETSPLWSLPNVLITPHTNEMSKDDIFTLKGSS